jgi:hypothetical protein
MGLRFHAKINDFIELLRLSYDGRGPKIAAISRRKDPAAPAARNDFLCESDAAEATIDLSQTAGGRCATGVLSPFAIVSIIHLSEENERQRRCLIPRR